MDFDDEGHNLERLEFKYLKDFDSVDKGLNNELFESITKLNFKLDTYYRSTANNYKHFFRVIYKDDEIIMFYNNSEYKILKEGDYTIGDIYLNCGSRLVKVNPDVVELKMYNLCDIDPRTVEDSVYEIKKELLTKLIKEHQERETLRLEKEEKERQEKILKEEKEKKDWKTSSEYTCRYFEIKGSKIFIKYEWYDSVNYSLDIDCKFSELYNFDQLSFNKYHKNPEKFIMDLNIRGVEIIKLEKGDKIFNFDFSNNKNKLNGTNIAKNSLGLLLRNLKKDFTEEDIKTINKLGVTRTQFISLDKVNVEGKINIPISIEVINKDLFNIEVGGISKEISWNLAQSLFRISRGYSSESMNYGNFKKLMIGTFEITKPQLFDILRKYKMLGDI